MSDNHTTILRTGLLALAFAAATACSGKPTPPPADPPPTQSQAQPPAADPRAGMDMGQAQADPHAGMDMSQTRPAPPLPMGTRGEELPSGHPPVTANVPAGGMGMPTIPPPPPGSGQGAAGMTWTTPAGWVQEKPSSSMRKAQYKVPGPGGDGELVVFYFGPGQGGDPRSNAERWAGQFLLADGTPANSAMKSAMMKVGAIDVMTVEVAGTYTGGMTMTMEPSQPKPGYMLLGAVAEGADSNWFFKFTGPEATVKAQRGAFESLLKSLKRGA